MFLEILAELGCHGNQAALSQTVSLWVFFFFLSVSVHLLFIRATQITDVLHHESMTQTHLFSHLEQKWLGAKNADTHAHTQIGQIGQKHMTT